jgi:prefoldin subunit 5
MKRDSTNSTEDMAKTLATETPTDAMALLQEVVRESYRQNQEDLRRLAEKLRRINEQKKAIRDYIAQLRAFRGTVLQRAREARIDLCDMDAESKAILARLFDELAVPWEAPNEETAEIRYELCIPERIPPAGTTNFGQLDGKLVDFEARLQSVGDDAQLANVELQMLLQKVQEIMQVLSNISKTQHETIIAIIRNLKG